MASTKQGISTGPKTKAGKAVAALNATKHGLTGNRVLPDEIQMVDDFVKELTTYYKPHSPLEILQIQRIAFCRAKLAKMMDIEVAGRELYRREIEANPDLVLAKLAQYPTNLRHLASLELKGQSTLTAFGLDIKNLQLICKEIQEFTGVLKFETDFPKFFPLLCGYLKKVKHVSEQADDLGWDQRLMIFAEKLRISTIDLNNAYTKVEPGSYEAAVLKIESENRLLSAANRRQDRQAQFGTDSYLRLLQADLNVITDLANSYVQVTAVLNSYEEMRSWMLRSVDLNAQESERMMRYQAMLEKRLSTAIGELLALHKLHKSNT